MRTGNLLIGGESGVSVCRGVSEEVGFELSFLDLLGEGVESSATSGRCHRSPVCGCLASPKSRRKALGSLAPVILHSRIGVARACAGDVVSYPQVQVYRHTKKLLPYGFFCSLSVRAEGVPLGCGFGVR